MSKYNDNVAELIFTVLMICVIAVIGIFWSIGSGYVKCESYAEVTDRQTKFSLISGCYVKNPKGEWIPHEEMTKSSVVNSK